MKEDDPRVVVGQLVDRVVRAIDERLPGKLQLTEASVPQVVQFFDLLRRVRGIQLHEAERDDFRGVLAGSVRDHLAVSEGGQHAGEEQY